MKHTECVDEDGSKGSETDTVGQGQCSRHNQGGVGLVFGLIKETICDDGCWCIRYTGIIESQVRRDG
jgi:hypothetical protein